MIRIADLYAGIGGIRLGFEQAFGKENIDCVCTSEIDKHAIKTYTANFGMENIYGDIRQLPTSTIPDHDILLAGFPCQSFSIAGMKKGFNDERGHAFFEIERILKDKKPKVFLLENVPHLKGINEGEIFRFMLKRLEEIGYKVSYEILSGKDFGVPQNRRRLYIVGSVDHGKNFKFPNKTNESTSVSSILEKDVDDSYILKDTLWQHFKKRSLKFKSGSFGKIYVYDGSEPFTNTLIRTYHHHCSGILVKTDGDIPRRLTVRECARLQGFADDFNLNCVSKTQAYLQLGNSVCVPVIKAIAEQIKTTFFAEEVQ